MSSDHGVSSCSSSNEYNNKYASACGTRIIMYNLQQLYTCTTTTLFQLCRLSTVCDVLCSIVRCYLCSLLNCFSSLQSSFSLSRFSASKSCAKKTPKTSTCLTAEWCEKFSNAIKKILVTNISSVNLSKLPLTVSFDSHVLRSYLFFSYYYQHYYRFTNFSSTYYSRFIDYVTTSSECKPDNFFRDFSTCARFIRGSTRTKRRRRRRRKRKLARYSATTTRTTSFYYHCHYHWFTFQFFEFYKFFFCGQFANCGSTFTST